MEVISPRQDLSLHATSRRSRQTGTKAKTPKQLQKLFTLYNEARDEFRQSPLSERLHAMLEAKTRPRVNKVISLGLGSLVESSKDQPRRIKQLVIFLAIAASMQSSTSTGLPVPLYAQDPSFTKTDEEFLGLLGVEVIRTPSASHLGEAGTLIDDQTLVYSPFLTIAAYTLLLGAVSSTSTAPVAPLVIGDDFNALKLKWEKKTAEHRDVEVLLRAVRSSGYQRRVLSGEGFWKETDHPFPMALYWRQAAGVETRVEVREPGKQKKSIKGRL